MKAQQHAPRGPIKADPMASLDLKTSRKCHATSKQTGRQCGAWAIRGGSVCRYHGGLAPQVIAKAEDRLKALIDPAIVRLAELVNQTQFPSVAIAAVKDVLDRNGQLGRPAETHDVTLNVVDERVRRLEAVRKKLSPSPPSSDS